MKRIFIMITFFSCLSTAAPLYAACTERCVSASLDFSGTQNSAGCYEVPKGGSIVLTACVANCGPCTESVRVELYASRQPFNVCSGTGSPTLAATRSVVLGPGASNCQSQTITIPATAPNATLYYQLRARTVDRRVVNATACSEVECVQIVDAK